MRTKIDIAMSSYENSNELISYKLHTYACVLCECHVTHLHNYFKN